jgi:hypothetical protein
VTAYALACKISSFCAMKINHFIQQVVVSTID